MYLLTLVTLPMILQWDESFDIGPEDSPASTTRTTNRHSLTAKFNKLTVKVDRPQLSPEDITKLQAAIEGESESRLITI